MEITRGRLKKAKKVVIYGPEGIGKSTFASRFPDPVFIDTEGSTNSMDVARLPRPTSWTMILEEIEYIKKNRNKDSSEDGSLQHADCKRCSDDGEHQGGNIETRQQYDTDDGKDSF